MTMHIPTFTGPMTLPEFTDIPFSLVKTLVADAAHVHRVRPSAIMSKDRTARISNARDDVFLALRNHGWSYPRIGRSMGRDHTSVMAGVKRARARRAEA